MRARYLKSGYVGRTGSSAVTSRMARMPQRTTSAGVFRRAKRQHEGVFVSGFD